MKKIFLFPKMVFIVLIIIIPVIILSFGSLFSVYMLNNKIEVLYFAAIILFLQVLGGIWIYLRMKKTRSIIIEKRKITVNELSQNEKGLMVFNARVIEKIDIKSIERISFFNNIIIYFVDDKKELSFVCTMKTFNKVKELLNLL